MKKTSLILSIAALLVAIAVLILNLTGGCGKKQSVISTSSNGASAVSGDIVYIQIDSLVMRYDMYNDLMSAFQSKAMGVQDELQKKGRKLESDMKAFENQIQKGLLTRSKAEEQQQALLQRQEALQNEANQKQYELQEEELVLNNQIMDAIKTYLKSYNAEHNFAAIITTSAATNIVIEASAALDITEDVLKGLNEVYIKNRNK
ncbi:MAG: OmpH family outer membrane protein [Bacteroidales bacterium]|nr:OmpH family outer membrane protein [Bacteroidales bacterium]